MIIELGLNFDGGAQLGTPIFEVEDFESAAKRQGIPMSWLNPCASCYLNGLCSDECGRHLFELDVNEEPR